MRWVMMAKDKKRSILSKKESRSKFGRVRISALIGWILHCFNFSSINIYS